MVAVRADGGGDGGVGLDERDVGDVAEENDGPSALRSTRMEQFGMSDTTLAHPERRMVMREVRRSGKDSNLPSIFIYKSVVDIEYKAFVA